MKGAQPLTKTQCLNRLKIHRIRYFFWISGSKFIAWKTMIIVDTGKKLLFWHANVEWEVVRSMPLFFEIKGRQFTKSGQFILKY